MTAYDDGRVSVHLGDCLDVLRTLPDASVDAVVTDPPYDLTANKRGSSGAASVNLDSPYGRSRIGTGNGSGGFMGKEWDSTGIAFRPEVWIECLRVLKPGGHMLAFGGTRTWHRLACAVEDAGFEVRDSIAWLYGSGFPKSLDVSKAIDRAAGATREVVGPRRWAGRMPNGGALGQMNDDAWVAKTDAEIGGETAPATPDAARWQGWGTALKPAFEPVVVARKPLQGTVAANVLAHGTGALNIDGCRIEATPEDVEVQRKRTGGAMGALKGNSIYGDGVRNPAGNPSGRWPANVVLDGPMAAALDEQSGEQRDGTAVRHNGVKAGMYGPDLAPGSEDLGYGGSGGASRFFYVAKAPKRERPRSEDGTAHPTVKPLDLMRWLVRLATPPGGTVLEPFAGSGTTVEACIVEGFRCIAIEREPDYLPLILQRIHRRRDPVAAIRQTGDDLGLFELDGESA